MELSDDIKAYLDSQNLREELIPAIKKVLMERPANALTAVRA
jgi:hypothetical protein